jgi:hypothetical protein
MGIAWCAIGRMASAQLPGLAVDPHVVVLSARQPAGKVVVFNPKATAAEYSIRMSYGWITTDSTGTPRVQLDDAPLDSIVRDSTLLRFENQHVESAARWVTAYPTRFILNPGASQTVRLLAKPPRALPDGEYWARLIIQSREVAPPLTSRRAADSTLRIGLSIETSTLIPIFYRTGTITTGIAVDALTARRQGDSLMVTASLRRLGNAAYVGAAQLSLVSDGGAPPITVRKRIAAYQTLTPRWTIPLPSDTLSRHYHLTLLLSTERPDVPTGTIIRAPTVAQTLEIPVP